MSLRTFDGNLSAQSSPDPLTLPRLAFADVTYIGGFRLPRAANGNDSFSYGGQHLAYNPARNSLFGASLRNNVAELTIPAPVNTTDVTQMPFAAYLQGFSDPSEGHFREIERGGPNGAVLAGLLVDGTRLYATGSIYYDASNSQVVSHFSHSTNLSEPSYRGMSQVWETGKAGFVGGYMANIPSEWQALLGGPALTGQCCIPIIGRTSHGPAAFGFDPAGIGNNTAVPAAPLLYYPGTHATLGPWQGANPIYGATTSMGGVAVIAGTRTALFIGRNGMGAYCYGQGVSDPALGGTTSASGQMNCYDPASSDKGQHAYPYRYQIWAYDLADFAAVKAGTKQPWEVVPYGVWPFELPTASRIVEIGGVAYDAERQVLYIAQYRADTDGYAERPIIHALQINVPSPTAPSPASTTVSLTPDAPAPQAPGALIRWSAAAAGGATPYEYRWEAYANGAWSELRDWSASPAVDWQPASPAPDARIAVLVRSAAATTVMSLRTVAQHSVETMPARAEYPFAIVNSPGESSAPVSSVALTTSLPAPQATGATIVWTATPAGATGPLLYKWFVSSDGASWTSMGAWTSSNQFAWTPAVANANYRVSAWVKRESNPRNEFEATSERSFPITAPAPASTRVTSVALTTNRPAPQPVGSTIVWTAAPAGGTGALLYKWYVSSNGVSWTSMGTWTPSNQFTWTAAVVNSKYRVSVWVKHASNPKNEYEATSERPFAITEAPAPRVTSVALTTDRPAPQPAGTTIVWTATPAGAAGALLYKWYVSSDGASWTAIGTWTSSNQFTWTPAAANAKYRVSAWVKHASNLKNEFEATAEVPFAISEPSFPVVGVALASDVPAPQEVSSTIVWTATPTGGTGALVFKWLVTSDGSTWNAVGTWTSSNQFTWTPDTGSAHHGVAVWAKRASNPADGAEAAAQQSFTILEPVTSVALAANLASPQPLSSTIEWTATPTGGAGDALVYRWFISDDDGASWTAVGPWAESNRWTWTPTAAHPRYRVSVWVKQVSDPADYPGASVQRRFAIK